MKKYIILVCIFAGNIFCASGDDIDVASVSAQINKLLTAEAKKELTVTSCTPEKRITGLMIQIDQIGQSLLKQDQTDAVITLSEKCLAILATLRVRRIYAYMLWAEGLLERASTGKYANLDANDQHVCMALYGKLSEINISIVNENMLNREIMTRLAEIYELLTPENKRAVRIRAIQQQRDALSQRPNITLRKTLDDF